MNLKVFGDAGRDSGDFWMGIPHVDGEPMENVGIGQDPPHVLRLGICVTVREKDDLLVDVGKD